MSTKSPFWRFYLQQKIPIVFKICPGKNYHWRWNYRCSCGIGINNQILPIILKPKVIIPISWGFLHPLIPQPRFLKRWYYRKSFEWWGHPSNNHWKQCCITSHGKLYPKERDIWTGLYCSGNNEVEKT